MDAATNTLSESAVLESLKGSETFAAMDPAALRRLLHYFEWISIGEDKEIIKEGDTSEFALLVVTGGLEVSKLHNNTKRLMAFAKPGSFVGELGLLTNERRYATCRAIRPSQVGLLARDRFAAMRSDDPELYSLVLSALSQQLAARLVKISDMVFHLKEKNTIAIEAATRILEAAVRA